MSTPETVSIPAVSPSTAATTTSTPAASVSTLNIRTPMAMSKSNATTTTSTTAATNIIPSSRDDDKSSHAGVEPTILIPDASSIVSCPSTAWKAPPTTNAAAQVTPTEQPSLKAADDTVPNNTTINNDNVRPTSSSSSVNNNKQVRFTGKEKVDGIVLQTESPLTNTTTPIATTTTTTVDGAIVEQTTRSSSSNRNNTVPNGGGFVSKRGRYVSPGRRSGSAAAAPATTRATSPPIGDPEVRPSALTSSSTAVANTAAMSSSSKKGQSTTTAAAVALVSSSSALEYETYSSNSAVPSLCSAPSQDEAKQPQAEEGKKRANTAPTSSRREKDDDDDISPDESNTTNNSNRNVLRGKSPTGLFLLSSPSVRPDRYVGTSTPTDFTADYKEGMPETSFDSSNVLAWLQSPTPNGFLFSPGFGSMLNTPNYNASSHTNTNNINHHQPSSSLSKQARSTSATPTPIVSTSFFFSDVAGLPKQPHTPAGTSSTGNSNIICISPLASKKQHNQNGQHYQQTPVDLKEIFASPVERKYRVMSTASNATMNKDAPSLDAVVLAERDLMEDEDLSVLLQLASNTTPRGNSVFRSTPRKHLRTTKSEENDNNLPGLQLPMIGGKSGSDNNDCPKARLSQKSTKCDDFAPPQLGMRSSSVTATATKEIYVGGTGDGNCSPSGMHQKNKDNGKKMLSKSSSIPIPGYSMYPPPDHSQYYQMLPPNIPPGMPTGSMHISLGGQPPSKSSKSSASGKSGTNSPPHPSSYSDYHNSAYGMPHMYAPYGVMGYPPYNSSHYPPPPPPPRHLSAYGTAQQSTVPPALGQKATTKSGSKSSESKSTVQTEKGGKKRSSIPGTDHCDSKTKKKKGSSSPTHPKRKNKSPQLTDHDERQKAADAIQNLNAASGGKNDKAAALAAAILRGVTMRPSGKWQAQLYFAGKSRYIGVFDTREKAALAYEIAREKLKSGHVPGQDGASTENLVNVARKAAFDGVNEQLTSK